MKITSQMTAQSPPAIAKSVNLKTDQNPVDAKKSMNADSIEISTEAAKVYGFNRYLSLPVEQRYNPIFQDIFDNLHETNKKIQSKIEKDLTSFYAGKSTIEDIKKSFADCFRQKLEANVAEGTASGTNKEENKGILLSAYTDFRYEVLSKAIGACYQKGAQFVTNSNPNYVYYDADYYYLSEDVKSAIDGCFTDLVKEYQMGDVQKPEFKGDSSRCYNNFNTYWNKAAVDGNEQYMKDNSLVPPKGFTLFFQDNKYSEDDYLKGTRYCISAKNNRAGTEETGSISWYLTVPRGASLLKKEVAFNLNALRKYGIIPDHNVNVIDINSMLTGDKSKDLYERVINFYYSHFNNFDEGVLRVSQGSWSKQIDVPFKQFTTDKSECFFNAGELITADKDSIPNSDKFNSFLHNFDVFNYLGYRNKQVLKQVAG